jgi:hypothetical protein
MPKAAAVCGPTAEGDAPDLTGDLLHLWNLLVCDPDAQVALPVLAFHRLVGKALQHAREKQADVCANRAKAECVRLALPDRHAEAVVQAVRAGAPKGA